MTVRFIAAATLATLCGASIARADGGAVRLSETRGPYRVTVFTSPTPLRAGPLDVSVLLSDAATGDPVSEASVMICLAPADRPAGAIERRATADAATTKLFHMASFDIGEPGTWSVEVAVEGPSGRSAVSTQLAIAPPLPRWLDLIGWIALPLPLIALFIVCEYRRERREATTSRASVPAVP